MATAVEVQKALNDTIEKMGWQSPTFLLIYEATESVKFVASWSGKPTEGQFQIAGQELVTAGQMMREMRIAQQLQLKVAANP